MAKTKRTAVKVVEPVTNNKVPSLLSGIGLFGLSQLEPVIVVALAIEEPLLLIGPHGTGKSLLLTRIAEALDLDFRHYNASLLNFDDLVGFPLPGKVVSRKGDAAKWQPRGPQPFTRQSSSV